MKTKKPAKKPILTDWRRVFAIRCKTKRGDRITEGEQALTELAWSLDPERYKAMSEEVFNATVPAGSTARWGK